MMNLWWLFWTLYNNKDHKTGTGYDFDGDNVVSKEEQACGMIVDENGNGKIDEHERKAMIQCLKGAHGLFLISVIILSPFSIL